jgi:enamine deaminase RidA (YjgF/YER057c/UK114 family)
MTAIERQQIGPCLSQACAHGPTVYLARQVADDPQADVMGQIGQILRKIDQLLEGAGTNKRGLLSATIWLSDIGTFADMNRVWDAWVAPGNTARLRRSQSSPHRTGRSRSRSSRRDDRERRCCGNDCHSTAAKIQATQPAFPTGSRKSIE